MAPVRRDWPRVIGMLAVALAALLAASYIGWRSWGPKVEATKPAAGKALVQAAPPVEEPPATATSVSAEPAAKPAPTAAAVATSAVTPTASATAPAPQPRSAPLGRAFMKGFNYAAYNVDVFNTSESDASLYRLAATGTNWLSIVPIWYQKTWRSNAIYRMPSGTASDQSVHHLIDQAQLYGMQVMLRPFVDSEDSTWRAWYEPTDRKEWFRSYTAMAVHYARMAEAEKLPLYCIGSEYTSSEKYEAEWRAVIVAVRKVYKGKLVYGADYHDITGKKGGPQSGRYLQGGYKNIKFWDALDLIGIDAYFPLTNKKDATVTEMEAGWRPWVQEMHGVSQRLGRPILITELMYLAADGANTNPGAYQYVKTLDLQEQADAYEATLRVIPRQDFIAGLFWWRWDNPSTSDWGGGPQSPNCSPKGKPAEQVLTKWWKSIP